MTNPVIFVDNRIINDETAFAYLKAKVRSVGLENVKYVNAYKEAYVAPKDLPKHYEPLKKYILKNKPSVVVICGNNMICTFGFKKKPEGITKLKGRVLTHEDFPDIPVIAIESPLAVDRDRNKELSFLADLGIIKKVASGNFKTQVDMVIHDIRVPSDIDDLIEASRKSGYCAYDYETSGLEKNEDIVGTAAFCPYVDNEGRAHVWYYAEYEQLSPCFEPKELEALKAKFTEFFELDQSENFERIAWNQNFDDWMTETWLGKKFQMSAWDAMYLKWAVATQRPHNLKFSTSVYLGYPEYDAFFDEKVNEVAKRRGRILTNDEDFRVLEFFGVEPDKTVREFKTKPPRITYRWPKKLSKKKAAYLTVEPEIVREYNCLDAAYTLLLFHTFLEKVDERGLQDSAELRHRAGALFMRGEQHGILLDVELNRQWSKELEHAIEEIRATIASEVSDYLPDGISEEKFNPGSPKQLNEVLYGMTAPIPVYDRDKILRYFKDEDILPILSHIEDELVYNCIDELKQQIKDEIFSYEGAQEFLEEEFRKAIFETEHALELPHWVNENYKIPFTKRLLGLGGLKYNPAGMTKSGQPSTSKTAMLDLFAQSKSQLINYILMYRKCVKAKATFVDKVYEARDENNIVRTAHNATGTNTGRASSSKSGERGFNIQQIPSGFKVQFIARPGYGILTVDVKQAEVYTLAAFADDEILKQALNDKDLHKFVASQIFKIPVDQITKDQRQMGKTTLFLTVYGGGATKLAGAFPELKVKDAEKIIRDFRESFKKSDLWLEGQKEIAHTAPYEVKTAFGTCISTINVLSSDYKEVLKAERRAGNAPIQGSAGEATLYKLCNIQDEIDERGLDMHWLLSVHDSASWEVPLDGLKVTETVNEKGEIEQEISGFYLDELVRKEFSRSLPFKPLDEISFKIDAEFYPRWGGRETDLKKIIKSDLKGEEFRWDIIKPDENEEDSREYVDPREETEEEYDD